MSRASCRLLEEQEHVSVILDLRTSGEIARRPLPHMLCIPVIHIPILESAALGIVSDSASTFRKVRTIAGTGMTGEAFMLQNYQLLAASAWAIRGYQKVFENLLRCPKGAVLFFCSQGRDRTGMVTLLILSALGVPMETIQKDYMLGQPMEKERRLIAVMERLRLISPAEANFARAFSSPSIARLEAALDRLEKQYGTVRNFLERAVGLSPADQYRLKELYLEQST